MGLSDFPETLYPAMLRYLNEYNRFVRRGYLKMRQQTAVITGLARNVEGQLPSTIARIERLGGLFKDYRVLVYENDSEDDTPAVLVEWARNNEKVNVITQKLGMPVNPGTRDMGRVERMAMYRNICRETIATDFSEYDFTVVADMDLPGGWSYDGVANSFGHPEWDFVGSNGLLYITPPKKNTRCVHFDAWAFRHVNHPEPHTAHEINPMQLQRGQPLLPVFSCFGGLGLYRTEAMIKSKYEGGDCEHVPFHNGMRTAGMNRLFVNPSQIVLYGNRSW